MGLGAAGWDKALYGVLGRRCHALTAQVPVFTSRYAAERFRFGPAVDGMAKGYLAELQHRASRENCRARDAHLVDEGSVGRIEVGHQKFVIGESDDAMFTRHALVRNHNGGRRGPTDLRARRIDHEMLFGKLVALDFEAVHLGRGRGVRWRSLSFGGVRLSETAGGNHFVVSRPKRLP